tara:strand:+ start:693 stop:953 length:261 start_codon:yes stop_codon:yes gene_type:complete
MKYVLRLKSSNERVFATDANNLDEAREIFMTGKQMDAITFDSMFTVTEYSVKEIANDNLDRLDSIRYRRKRREKLSRVRRNRYRKR